MVYLVPLGPTDPTIIRTPYYSNGWALHLSNVAILSSCFDITRIAGCSSEMLSLNCTWAIFPAALVSPPYPLPPTPYYYKVRPA